jgi:protein-tyrosine phosphatase
MIDLHCHLLDETSCGPETLAESLEMCRAAVKEGVRTIVATPSWDAASMEPPLPFADCQRKLEHLEHEMGETLSLKLGFMMRWSTRLPELVRRFGPGLTLGGSRDLLVSIPSLYAPPEIEEVWDEIARLGYSIVVARPECSLELRRDPARLERWLAASVRAQIDAASLNGKYGREIQRFALQCLKKHPGSMVVASNAHHADRRWSSLGQAHQKLIKLVGARQAWVHVSARPDEILNADQARPLSARAPNESLLSALMRPLRQTG